MHSNCVRPQAALRVVVEKSLKRKVIFWNTLIAKYTRVGKSKEALQLFEKMELEGAEPNSFTFVWTLKACSTVGAPGQGKLLHACIVIHGLEADLYIESTLVGMYARWGCLEDAHKVFDKLSVHDVVSWSALIAGYTKHGCSGEALRLFQKMQQEGTEPDVVTYVCVLKACSSTTALKQGKLIHAGILKRGFDLHQILLNILVDMYVKCSSLADAQKVFERLPVKDVVSWSTMIAGYSDHGHSAEAIQIFEKMQQEGTEPNKVTFMSILKACSSTVSLEQGRLIHTSILKQGFDSDQILVNILVDMYVKCGSLADAQNVFDNSLIQDDVSWSRMISGYAEHGHVAEAVKLFDKMQWEGVEPNRLIYVSILKACSSLASLEQGRAIHGELIQHDLDWDLFIGNTLINVYAKCGCIEDARKVFDRLPSQNVVSWSVIITGYSDHGLYKEALQLFKKMQRVGMELDKRTFTCILKACANTASLHQGRLIHADIMKHKFESDTFVGSSLVSMYIKCGSIEDARNVFDRMPVQGTIAWSSLIGGYVEHGNGQKALRLFEKMRQHDSEPDEVTFASLFKACSSTAALDHGKQIHAETIRIGMKSNFFLGSAMVDMYAKCSCLDDARRVFDSLLKRNVASWNAMIGGYADTGCGEAALRLFKKMQQEGVAPNRITFLCVLKACSSLDLGKLINADIMTRGLQSDLSVGNSLIDLYAQCGSIDDARNVFENLAVRDVVSWSAMMLACIEHGDAEEAFLLFKNMQQEGIEPNEVTFVCILKGCSNLVDLDQGKLIHTLIKTRGLESDLFVGSSLIDMYGKCGSLEDAHEVFDKLQGRNVVSWSAMIAGYANCGYDEEVLNLFEKMQLEGTEPNEVTFMCVLQVISSIGALDKGKVIHIEILKRGLEPDLFVGNTLVGMYAKCGILEDACRMFDKLTSRNVVSWNAIIAGFADHGYCETAQQYFGDMQEEGVEPDGVTFVCLLSSCSHAGLVQEGHRLFYSMKEDCGVVPGMEHNVCMVDMLGRAGRLCDAEEWISKMSFEPDSVVWTTLLGSCAKYNNLEVGKQIFDRLVPSDRMNGAGYVLMSNIYAANYMWQDAKRIREMWI